MRSGKNPLAQIVKRLHELDGSDFDKVPKSSAISLKAPNNAYILNDTTCCVVIEETHQSHVREKCFSCRVYNNSDALFNKPCDSRIIGVHKARAQFANMKILPASSLTKQAIDVELHNDVLVFLAILHEL